MTTSDYCETLYSVLVRTTDCRYSATYGLFYNFQAAEERAIQLVNYFDVGTVINVTQVFPQKTFEGWRTRYGSFIMTGNPYFTITVGEKSQYTLEDHMSRDDALDTAVKCSSLFSVIVKKTECDTEMISGLFHVMKEAIACYNYVFATLDVGDIISMVDAFPQESVSGWISQYGLSLTTRSFASVKPGYISGIAYSRLMKRRLPQQRQDVYDNVISGVSSERRDKIVGDETRKIQKDEYYILLDHLIFKELGTKEKDSNYTKLYNQLVSVRERSFARGALLKNVEQKRKEEALEEAKKQEALEQQRKQQKELRQLAQQELEQKQKQESILNYRQRISSEEEERRLQDIEAEKRAELQRQQAELDRQEQERQELLERQGRLFQEEEQRRREEAISPFYKTQTGRFAPTMGGITDIVKVDEVFTDASLRDGYTGIGLFYGDHDERNNIEILRGVSDNNQGELIAILRALQGRTPNTQLVIYTDSQESINAITIPGYGWRTNPNYSGTLGQIDNLMDSKVSILHSPSHQREPINRRQWKLWYGNDRADFLASLASQAASV